MKLLVAWDDPDKVRGTHCLVNWKHCSRPKRLGGLGIKDLDKFGRALYVRWLWFSWDTQARPWKKLLKFHDKSDRALFFASTVITPFWDVRWLNGVSPKELAPNLYKQARFKFRTVGKELQNFNWIKNLKAINTENLMDEFVLLFSALSEVTLNNDRDKIVWHWTPSGEYSAASVYDAHFLEVFPQFRASTIWQAKSEPKCRFFVWLALLGKAPTTDNLIKKNWPCDPCCALCYCLLETADHLLTECNFTEAVWDKVALHFQENYSPNATPAALFAIACWKHMIQLMQFASFREETSWIRLHQLLPPALEWSSASMPALCFPSGGTSGKSKIGGCLIIKRVPLCR
jgi:hypothetical protein